MPDAGIVPSAQADGKVRQLAGGTRGSSGLTESGLTDSPLYGSRQPREAATQLGYAHRRLSPPLPTEADRNRSKNVNPTP